MAVVGSNLTGGADLLSPALITTASVSVLAGEFVVVSVESRGGTPRSLSTVVGLGLTWVIPGTNNNQANTSPSAEIAFAYAFNGTGSTQTGTIAITLSGTSSVGRAWSVDKFTNMPSTPAVVQGAVNAANANPSITFGAAPKAENLVILIGCRLVNATAAMTNYTFLGAGANGERINTLNDLWVAYRVGETSTAVGMTNTTSGLMCAIGIEFLGAIIGTGAGLLPKATDSGAGAVLASGTGTDGLPKVAGAGAGGVPVSGSGAPALPRVASAGDGDVFVVSVPGASSATAELPRVADDGAGKVKVSSRTHSGQNSSGVLGRRRFGRARLGQGSLLRRAFASLPTLADAGLGTVRVTGVGSAHIAVFLAAGHAIRGLRGSGSIVLGRISAAGTGQVVVLGAGLTTLENIMADGEGGLLVTGAGGVILPMLSAEGLAAALVSGAGAGALAILHAEGGGGVIVYRLVVVGRPEVHVDIEAPHARFGAGAPSTRWKVGSPQR